MNIIKYIISAFLLSSACTKPYNIDFEDIDNRIVVNSFFFPDSIMKIHLTEEASLSRDIWGGNFKLIENAEIIIYGNEQIIDTAQYKGNGYYYADFKPQKNILYKIKVNAPGYNEVIAKDQIPNIVTIDTIKISKNNDDYYNYKVRVVFSDPPNEDNYYFLSAAWKMKDEEENNIWWSNVYLRTEDPLIGKWTWTSSRVPIFNDQIFNGKKYELTFDMRYTADEKDYNADFYLNLKCISKSMYLYLKSYNQQAGGSGDDLLEYFQRGLMEPIPIYSNVEGGLGIFAGYAVSQDSVLFE